MADDDFATNLVRFVASQMHVLIGLQMAQDMFGKSYHSLGAMEKVAVDQAALGMVAANYNSITPEYLRTQPQTQQPMGFQSPAAAPKAES